MLLEPGMAVFNSVDPPLEDGQIAFGTAGGIVYHNGTAPVFLTCFHCIKNPHLDFAQFKRDGINDKASTFLHLQPNRFGEITKAKMCAEVDVAIIDPDLAGNTISDYIPQIGRISGIPVPGTIKVNDRVTKLGKMSGKTDGVFWGISPSTGVSFPPDSVMHFFSKLLMFKGIGGDFAVEGDSGAFVLNTRNEVLGMIVLVDKLTHITYAIPSDQIERHINVTFIKKQTTVV